MAAFLEFLLACLAFTGLFALPVSVLAGKFVSTGFGAGDRERKSLKG